MLAIMAAMAAFAMPSLHGSLDKSRLRAGARQVRAALAKTRSLAIREGVPLIFQFEANGRRWSIERMGTSLLQRPSAVAGDGIRSGLTTDRSATEDAPPGLQHTSVLREGFLPEGVAFAAATPLPEQDLSGLFDDQRPDDIETRTTAGGPEPITFRPNGRSEDRILTIVGSRDFVITVTVRGLTSNVSYSSPFRQRSAIVEDSTAVLLDGAEE